MEISRLLSAMIGMRENTDAKQLELKVGQVVRGIVMQLFADSEALVNIAGVSVRAKLESPLQPGQATLLQVRPQSTAGQILLQPLTDSGVPIPEQSLADLAKSLGLKDTEANRIMLRELHLAGIPLTAKQAQRFEAAVQDVWRQQGGRAELKTIVDAAIVAYRKDLPIRSEIVAPLHQAMSGQSLNTLNTNLTQALQVYLQPAATGGSDAAMSSSLPIAQRLADALVKLQQLLPVISQGGPASSTSGAAVTAQAAGAYASAASAAGAAEVHAPAVNAQTANALFTQPAASIAASSANHAQAAAASIDQPPAATQSVANAASAGQAQGASSAEQAARLTNPMPADAGAMAIRTENGASPASAAATAAPPPDDSAGRAAERALLAATQQGREEPWIKLIFRHLGLDYERRAVDAIGHQTVNTEALEAAKDTVKGLILQLAADDRLPAALKEALQQTLQQITGQQLLLGSERGAPIAIMTMLVPVGEQGDGADHAAVQIQARKNKNGRFDSDNCRLIFDLQMNRLGNTIIDAAVVNRIVSLQIHNDHPLLSDLLEELRPDIDQALASIGYQFISIKHLPYPIGPSSASEQGRTEQTAAIVSSSYRNQPYKGVDLRV